jgi:esterase/lipase superfamily enzyme
MDGLTLVVIDSRASRPYASSCAVREPADFMLLVTGKRSLLALLAFAMLFADATGSVLAEEPFTDFATAEPARAGQAPVNVGVFYLTNREYAEGSPAADRYNGNRGMTRFGRCEVEFTPIPFVNDVASRLPFYVQKETSTIKHAEQLEPSDFWEAIADSIDRTGSVVLFVHGYNYGFERTCRMATEMQRYLQGRATVIVFSWPSNGLPSDYVKDLADIEWSVPLLSDFIGQLGERIGPGKLRLLAHSLGSRGVIQALLRLGVVPGHRPLLADLVLLAPDYDAQSFIDLLPRLQPVAAGITLYASANDTPLRLSRQLSGYPRLGEGGEYLTVVEGVETIDVSSAGMYQITGHEYFYFHPLVTTDLQALLGDGVRAGERTGLQEMQRNGVRYWAFAQTRATAASTGDAAQ